MTLTGLPILNKFIFTEPVTIIETSRTGKRQWTDGCQACSGHQHQFRARVYWAKRSRWLLPLPLLQGIANLNHYWVSNFNYCKHFIYWTIPVITAITMYTIFMTKKYFIGLNGKDSGNNKYPIVGKTPFEHNYQAYVLRREKVFKTNY